MVALGEEGDSFDVGLVHERGELFGIKGSTNVGDGGAGVEIEMDLTGGQCKRFHNGYLLNIEVDNL